MEERQSRWSSMAWKRSQPYFCVRLIRQNSMFSNFCHLLKLRIELSENQISGRVIDISIEYNDILNADGFSPDVLRSIAKAPVVPHMNRDYYEQPKSK